MGWAVRSITGLEYRHADLCASGDALGRHSVLTFGRGRRDAKSGAAECRTPSRRAGSRAADAVLDGCADPRSVLVACLCTTKALGSRERCASALVGRLGCARAERCRNDALGRLSKAPARGTVLGPGASRLGRRSGEVAQGRRHARRGLRTFGRFGRPAGFDRDDAIRATVTILAAACTPVGGAGRPADGTSVGDRRRRSSVRSAHADGVMKSIRSSRAARAFCRRFHPAVPRSMRVVPARARRTPSLRCATCRRTASRWRVRRTRRAS